MNTGRLLIIFSVLLFSGCAQKTLNIGSVGMQPPLPGNIAIDLPENPIGGEPGTFTLTWEAGRSKGPFLVFYTFNDCVDPLTYTHVVDGETDMLTVDFLPTETDQLCRLFVTLTTEQALRVEQTLEFEIGGTIAN